MSYSTISAGPGATNRAASAIWNGFTVIQYTSPASASGILNSMSVWYNASAPASIKMGTFVFTATDNFAPRDYETLSSPNSGSKTTWTGGVNCDVVAGDYLGVYGASGVWEKDDFTNGMWYKSGYDGFASGTAHYSQFSEKDSLEASGITVPDAPTGVSATDNLADKVTITATRPTSQNTTGYHFYRDATDLGLVTDATSGGTISFNDTGGTAGITYSYTVKAVNLAGLSAASSADNGVKVASGLVKPGLFTFNG